MQMTGSTLEGKLLRRPGHLTMSHPIHNDQVIPEAKCALLMMPTSAMRGYLVDEDQRDIFRAMKHVAFSAYLHWSLSAPDSDTTGAAWRAKPHIPAALMVIKSHPDTSEADRCLED
jgi:hypothetical protein